MMHRKIFALIIIVLFIVTVFNGPITAKEDIRKKFGKLDVKSCIKTEDYSELLKFMGNNSKIVLSAWINASGIGLHLGKPIYYISIKHPFLKLKKMGFPPGLLQQWIIYAKYNDENASVYVEPKNGEPFYINGSHSILVGIWIVPPIDRIFLYQRFLKKYFEITIALPESLDKWRGMPFFDWKSSLGLIESLIMFLVWPFNIKVSFVGLTTPLSFYGMTPFVIYRR